MKHSYLLILAAFVFSLAALGADVPYDPLAPADAFQIGSASNLPIGDSFVNMSNAGINGAGAIGFSFDPSNSICVNTYVHSADSQMVACCTCKVIANALESYSVRNDLIFNPLTGIVPTSAVIKLVATEPIKKGATTICDATVPGKLAGGLSVWATSLHAAPTSPVTYVVTDSPFHNKVLGQTEYQKLTFSCNGIVNNGSSFGICRGCRLGGL